LKESKLANAKAILKNESGAALITTLLVLLILGILGTVIFFAAQTEARRSIRHSDKVEAYYLARSGVESASEKVMQSDDLEQYYLDEGDTVSFNNVKDVLNNTFDVPGGSIKEVYALGTEELGPIIIIATASVNDVEETVKLKLNPVGLVGSNIFDYAVFALGDSEVDLEDGNLSLGQLEIESKKIKAGTNYHNIEAGRYDLDAYPDDFITNARIDRNEDLPELDLDRWDEEGDDDDYPLEIISDPMTESGYYESIETNNLEFTFDTTEEDDLYVRTPMVDLGGNGSINVVGEGVLHLLVEEKFILSGTSTIRTDEDTDVIVYVLEDADIDIQVTLDGGPSLDAFLYAPDSKVELRGGGREGINGGLICKEFDVSGGAAKINHDEDLLITKGAFTKESLNTILDGSGATGFSDLVRERWLD